MSNLVGDSMDDQEYEKLYTLQEIEQIVGSLYTLIHTIESNAPFYIRPFIRFQCKVAKDILGVIMVAFKGAELVEEIQIRDVFGDNDENSDIGHWSSDSS